MKKLTKIVQDKKLKRYSYAEDVAEEIQSYLGIKTKAEQGVVSVDTIIGELHFVPQHGKQNLMYEVYRFINHYGLKLADYGLKNKLKSKYK